jgi:hypothetical protein
MGAKKKEGERFPRAKKDLFLRIWRALRSLREAKGKVSRGGRGGAEAEKRKNWKAEELKS